MVGYVVRDRFSASAKDDGALQNVMPLLSKICHEGMDFRFH
jgi:hypothetical protein